VSTELISIVLPIYNQASHIARTVAEYEAGLTKLPHPHELLLVVNGSDDGSLEICRDLESECGRVRVLESERGWGHAVKLGLSEARGDLLCYTNSARTSAEQLLLLLMYAIVFPEVVVKANRRIRDNWRRRLGSLMYNLECRALFDLSNWDINGTPKVFPRTFGKLLQLSCDDDLIDLEFNVVCRREGYPMLEVPIFATRRHGGRSTTDYRSAFKLYRGALDLRRALGASRE
jgi:glycosyltransferase involved in cell wall biosynthesis